MPRNRSWLLRSAGILLNVDIQRLIQMLRYIFAVFLALPDTFREEIFNLSVDGTEIILGPGSDIIIQFFR